MDNNLAMNIETPEIDNENVLKFEKPAIVKPDVPAPIGIDWLTPLATGTVFLVKSKNFSNPNMKIFLGEYHKSAQFSKAILIYTNLNKDESYAIVDPIEFCKAFDLFEVTKAGEDL